MFDRSNSRRVLLCFKCLYMTVWMGRVGGKWDKFTLCKSELVFSIGDYLREL